MNEGVAFDQEKIQDIIINLCFSPEGETLSFLPKIKKEKIIVIAGPTGCGKTELSLIIAKNLGCEIVSADSMQVYKEMDIGTAKILPEQRQNIPHHLIDILDLKDSFSVADFSYEARRVCDSISARNKVPVVVGGSGFYLRSFIYGPPAGPPSVSGIRQNLENQIKKNGPELLYNKLESLDPEYASTITPRDTHKIVRALEIMSITDEKVSNLSWNNRKEWSQYDFCCWFLHRSKPLLYQRIEERCDEMLKKGLLDEVKTLEKKGLKENSSASQSIGYRHCLKYLNSKQTPQDYNEMVRSFKVDSRRYAKRQFTWFKKEPLFRWISVEDHDLETVADIIMNEYSSRT